MVCACKPQQAVRPKSQFSEGHAMYQLLSLIKNFITDEEGATAVEYGVLIALIIAVCIIVIGVLGTKIENAFNRVAAKIPTT
jgi:pilus assembly protein Flp/PilA